MCSGEVRGMAIFPLPRPGPCSGPSSWRQPPLREAPAYGRPLRLAERSCNRCGRPAAAMLPWAGQLEAVRTTGLLTARRNRRTERTPSPNCWRPTATTLFSKGSYPRPLDCGLGPLPGRVFFAIGAPTGHSTAAVTGGVQPDASRGTRPGH